jgi:hypothetical protein
MGVGKIVPESLQRSATPCDADATECGRSAPKVQQGCNRVVATPGDAGRMGELGAWGVGVWRMGTHGASFNGWKYTPWMGWRLLEFLVFVWIYGRIIQAALIVRFVAQAFSGSK